MTSVVFTKDFSALLRSLLQGGKRAQVTKARAAMAEAQTEGEIRSLARTHHGESRLKCEKYDLGDGYRLVVQVVNERSETRAFLFVGSHAEADDWLERHRDYQWVARKSDGVLAFTQVTIAPPSPSHAPRPIPDINLSTPYHERQLALLRGIAVSQFEAVGFELPAIEFLLSVTGEAWETDPSAVVDRMASLAGIEKACLAQDLLSEAYRGEWDALQRRLELAGGAADLPSGPNIERLMSSPVNAESFFTWSDAEGLPAAEQWSEWMLFLSKEQRDLAQRYFSGPARLRGVSGSGKTCVLIHRARYLAKAHADRTVVVLTLTESMRKLIVALLCDLCGAEASRIQVFTIAAWAKHVVHLVHPRKSSWYLELSTPERDEGIRAATARLAESGFCPRKVPDDELYSFVREEFEYIDSRLTTADLDEYLDPAQFPRTGRGIPLSRSERAACLDAFKAWKLALRSRPSPLLDHYGVTQAAIEQLQQDSPGIDRGAISILVDEVQDLTELDLKLISMIRSGPTAVTASDNGLFLVGDGAQTIYRRGFSLRRLGIGIQGRSFALKKNYRNSADIMRCAYQLIERYEFADIDEDNIQRPLEPDLATRRGGRPAIVKCKSLRDESGFVSSHAAALLRENPALRPGDICVIGTSDTVRRSCAKAIEAKGLSTSDLRSDAGEPGRSIRISTIESAKGHEFSAVFVTGLIDELMPRRGSEDPGGLSAEAARLYVAMTRARDMLFMSYSLSEQHRPSRYLSSLQDHSDEFAWKDGGLVPLTA